MPRLHRFLTMEPTASSLASAAAAFEAAQDSYRSLGDLLTARTDELLRVALVLRGSADALKQSSASRPIQHQQRQTWADQVAAWLLNLEEHLNARPAARSFFASPSPRSACEFMDTLSGSAHFVNIYCECDALIALAKDIRRINRTAKHSLLPCRINLFAL